MGTVRSEAKTRNPMVDIWRMFFAVIVVVRHTRFLPWSTEQLVPLRSESVEFFFILPGFLMAQSIRRSEGQRSRKLGDETVSFLLRKVKSIFPMYIAALLMDTILRFILTYPKQGINGMDYVYYIWDVLFLRAAGLRGYSGDAALGGAWYLHAMFLALALLYPLARKYSDVFRNILAPLMAIFIYGWFCNVHGRIHFTLQFESGVCLGRVRAVAGICLGAVCHCLCCWLQNLRKQKDKLFCIVMTALELFCFGGAIGIARYCEHSRYDFISILLISAGLVCSFSGYSALVAVAEKIPTAWIGRYSLAIYLNHYVWIRILYDWKLPVHFTRQMEIFFIMSTISTFVCIWSVELTSRIWKRIGGKGLKWS